MIFYGIISDNLGDLNMSNHNLEQFEMYADNEGEMVIPSEVGNMKNECNLRQFLIMSERQYSESAVSVVNDIKVRVNSSAQCHDPSLLYVNFLMKPEGDLKDFIEEKGDEFFDSLLKIAGYCDIRGVRGNRGAFVSYFQLVEENGLELWKSKILLSTSVFYNDYRVTTGFPFTDKECTSVLEDMYGKLNNEFPDVEFELSWEKMNEDANVFS